MTDCAFKTKHFACSDGGKAEFILERVYPVCRAHKELNHRIGTATPILPDVDAETWDD